MERSRDWTESLRWSFFIGKGHSISRGLSPKSLRSLALPDRLQPTLGPSRQPKLALENRPLWNQEKEPSLMFEKPGHTFRLFAGSRKKIGPSGTPNRSSGIMGEDKPRTGHPSLRLYSALKLRKLKL